MKPQIVFSDTPGVLEPKIRIAGKNDGFCKRFFTRCRRFLFFNECQW